MTGLPVDDIVLQTGAILKGHTPTGFVRHLLIDSRKLLVPETSMFFAIRTSQRDGHVYIDDLYQKGVRNFMVNIVPETANYPEASFYVTENVIAALQKLAICHRRIFNIPVIGITGSNGKTIVKEWLFHLLSSKKNIVRSPRSYNSQLGVPLSIWQMEPANELGIFEAGISKKGEMQQLQKIIQPTLGIMTNIGAAHSEGFASMEEKLVEKCLLFEGVDSVIYCKDHTMIDEYLQQMKTEGKIGGLFSWGKESSADVQLIKVDRHPDQSEVTVRCAEKDYVFKIPYFDQAAIENAMHCCAAVFALGIDTSVFQRMSDLPPLQMRLEMKEGQNGCTLINDSYNADLNGLMSALEFMGMQQDARTKTAILSDISGMGTASAKVYEQVLLHLTMKGVKKLFAVGPAFMTNAPIFQGADIDVRFFADTEELLKALNSSSLRNELILIKGARNFKFEKVSQLLESKTHQTRLEVDLAAIAYNLGQFKSLLPPDTKWMAMVKAFSYGAGSFEVANLLQFHRVDHIAVAYVDEGVELRKAGIHTPIMVMNTEPGIFQTLVDHDLEPELYSLEIIESLYNYLRKEGVSFYPVHIKLNTGMNRLGLDQSDAKIFLDTYALSSQFRVRSVFTHLVASEDSAHDAFTDQQLDIFEQICGMMQERLGYFFLRHAANTAAIARHPRAAYEMVRLGIGLYGIDTGKTGLALEESVTLKTTIAQIRNVARGETVGYGRRAIMSRDSRIATIRIGYADGLPRSLGNGKGSVMINGKHCPIAGNICMDMTMVDITEYPDVSIDDEVIVFGKEHSITQLAAAAGTIPYEIMTGISQRVPRVYLT
jgi:alanine racemase